MGKQNGERLERYKSLERKIRLGYLPKGVEEVYLKKQQRLYNKTPDIRFRKMMSAVKMHQCEFGENDYCLVCELDGRA